MSNVTKADMIDKMAKEVGLSKKQANEAIDSVITNVTKALKKGDKVTFVGFGTFISRKRKARTARNPRTGDSIHVPARKVPVFRPGASLKDAVR